MPIYKLAAEMPYTELQGWFEYLSKYPIGWREDYRVSLQLAAAGSKVAPSKMFSSLAAIEAHQTKRAIDPVKDTLKGSFLFSLMLGAKGGDDIGGILNGS